MDRIATRAHTTNHRGRTKAVGMPKIKSYSAPWLQDPNPGHRLFKQSEDNSRLPASIAYSRNASSGPKRTIAQRGNEVFVASGREIRWGDIAYLNYAFEAHQSRARAASHLNGNSSDSSFEVYDEETSHLPQGPGYRVCGFTSPILDRRWQEEYHGIFGFGTDMAFLF